MLRGDWSGVARLPTPAQKRVQVLTVPPSTLSGSELKKYDECRSTAAPILRRAKTINLGRHDQAETGLFCQRPQCVSG